MQNTDLKLMLSKVVKRPTTKAKKTYNLNDPMQRKKWWVDKVVYFCSIIHDKDTAAAMRMGLQVGHPSAKRLANQVWDEKKRLDNLIKGRVDGYKSNKENFRQKHRDRGK